MENGPREIPIHQSANRPQLLLGGDREMVLFAMLIAACLVFAVMTWWGVLTGLLFWWTSVAVLHRMGKADPLMRHAYIRHIRYTDFYPAKSRLHAQSSTTPLTWR